MKILPYQINQHLAGWVKNQRGNAAIVLALAMPLVVGSAAFGVETSYWYYKQSQLQAAADTAAYSGALEKRAGSSYDTIFKASQSSALDNGYEATGGSITVDTPPKTGPNAGGKAVEVNLQEKKDRYFTKIFLT